MNINQCQELAKRMEGRHPTFDLVGPKGRLKATWLDVDLGFIAIEGEEGFIMAHDLMWVTDIHCEHLADGNAEPGMDEEVD